MLRTLTGIGELATKEANSAVSKVLEYVSTPQPPGPTTSRKTKATVFSPEQRAFIGKCATENSNSAAIKKNLRQVLKMDCEVSRFSQMYLNNGFVYTHHS